MRYVCDVAAVDEGESVRKGGRFFSLSSGF